ncbi:MAG: DUF58 domain-containing protein [Microthrixaceae bacterium]
MKRRLSGPEPDRPAVGLTPGVVAAVLGLSITAGLRPSVATPVLAGVVWAGAAMLVLIGVLWPLLDRSAAAIRVVGCPQDLIEGSTATVTLARRPHGRPVEVSFPGWLAEAGEALVLDSDTSRFEVRFVCRGLYRSLPISVTDRGPFGLIRVTRRIACVLPATLHVEPRSEPAEVDTDPSDTGAESAKRASAEHSGDVVRGVRAYEPGDPAHLVHWRTTARVGSLMTKELEPPQSELVAIVVDLRGGAQMRAAGGGPFEPVEKAVRRSAGALAEVLVVGARVVLCTAEASGAVTAEVLDLRQGLRRLAAARDGVPGVPPKGARVLRMVPDTVNGP